MKLFLFMILLCLLIHNQVVAQYYKVFNYRFTSSVSNGAPSAYSIHFDISASDYDNAGKGVPTFFDLDAPKASVDAAMYSQAAIGIGRFFITGKSATPITFSLKYGYDTDGDKRIIYSKVTYSQGDYKVKETAELPVLGQDVSSGCNLVNQNCFVNQYYTNINFDRSRVFERPDKAYTQSLIIRFYIGQKVDKVLLVPITVMGKGAQFKGTGDGPIELVTILRAAPGDKSFTFWESNKETSNEISTSIQESSENGTTISGKANVGIKAGPFEGGVEVEGSKSTKTTKTGKADSSYVVTYSTTTRYKNEGKSDMFIAEQYKLDYGLEYDLESFSYYAGENINKVFVRPKTSTRMLFFRGKLVRPYQKTEEELLTTYIPELEATNRKSEARFWRGVIAMNNRIKANAPVEQKGVELSTNGPEVTFATTKSSTQAYTQEISLEKSSSLKITDKVGFEAGPVSAGAEVSVEKTWVFTTTTSLGNTNTSGNTKTIGYQIADNQFGTGGDKIVYDLKTDGVFGTPIFVVDSLKSKTSCPAEPGTVARDQLSITVQDPVTLKDGKTAKVSDVALTGEAIFNLSLKNENKDEARKYRLSVPFPTDGVLPIISIPGIGNYPIDRLFTIPKGGTQAIVLSIKNSRTTALGFANIKLLLESECDDTIADSVQVSVYFGDSDKNRAPDNDLACNAVDMPANGSLQTTFKNKFGTTSTITNKNATSPTSETVLTPKTDCSAGWCSETPGAKALINNSVWFKFVAKSPLAVVSMCDNVNDTFDSQLAVYTVTDCEDLTTFKLVSANDNSCGTNGRVVAENLTVGATYYVLVDGFNGMQRDFGLRITSPAPDNDNSCSFEFLTVNGLPNQGKTAVSKPNFHYTNHLATVEKNEPVLTPVSKDPTVGWKADVIQNSVWFAFEAPAGGEMTVDINNATFDAQVSVYATNGNVCGPDIYTSYTLIGANDDASLLGGQDSHLTLTGLTPLKRYLILVDGYKGETGTFDIVLASTPPANDEPCNAIAIATDGVPRGMFRNSGATTTAKEQALVIPYNVNGAKGWADQAGDPRARVIERSVWFKFVAPTSGSVKISTCNMATFQLQMAVYQAAKCVDYATFKYLAADDNSDVCPAPPDPQYPNGRNVRGSMITIDKLLPDSTYYILVDGGLQDYGNFNISITVPPSITPINDNVCKAIALPTNGVVQKGFTNLGATVTNAERSLAPTNKWNDASMNSTVWFSFVAPASGEAEISTCNLANFDTQLAVFASTTCTDFSTFTLAGANEDGPKDCATKGDSFLPLTGLTPGKTYYLVVDGYESFTGNFDIVIKDKITAGPSNDDVTKAILLPVNNVVQNGYTNILGTATKAEQAIKSKNTGDCINGWCDDQIDNSVWFKFVAPADGAVNVSTCDLANFDTQLAVYSATDAANFGTYTLVAANDAGPAECSTFSDSYLPIKGLKAGQTYYVMVDGFNGDAGNFDIMLSGTPDSQAPTGPTNLSASATTTTATKLTWTASTDNLGVKEYRLYVDGVLKATTTDPIYSLSGLTASTTYSVLVVAVDAAGNVSAPSTTLRVTTLAIVVPDSQAPSVPVNLVSSEVQTTSFKLNWAASTDNVGVKEYRIFVDGVLKTTTTDLSLTVSGLTAGTIYTVYVVAVDAAGNASVASTSLKVTTTSNLLITAVDEFDIASQFTVFPNPFSDFVTVKLANALPFPDKIEVLNLQGKVVLTPKLTDRSTRIIRLDLTTHPAGIYFLMVKTKAGVGYKRVMKQ